MDKNLKYLLRRQKEEQFMQSEDQEDVLLKNLMADPRFYAPDQDQDQRDGYDG